MPLTVDALHIHAPSRTCRRLSCSLVVQEVVAQTIGRGRWHFISIYLLWWSPVQEVVQGLQKRGCDSPQPSPNRVQVIPCLLRFSYDPILSHIYDFRQIPYIKLHFCGLLDELFQFRGLPRQRNTTQRISSRDVKLVNVRIWAVGLPRT